MFKGNNREAYLLSIFHIYYIYSASYCTSSVLASRTMLVTFPSPKKTLNDIDVFLFNPKTDFGAIKLGPSSLHSASVLVREVFHFPPLFQHILKHIQTVGSISLGSIPYLAASEFRNHILMVKNPQTWLVDLR